MRVLRGVMLLSVCALVAVTVRVSAQGQQTPPAGRQGGAGPKNLQVLPKDWTGQQVQQFMRTYFNAGLGVMCNDCHVQDRSADDKKEKQVARQMLKMVMAINNDFLKDVGEKPAEGQLKVTCYTCHRGQRKPINAAPAGGGF